MWIFVIYLYYQTLQFFGYSLDRSDYVFWSQEKDVALLENLRSYHHDTHAGSIAEQISGFLLYEPYKQYLLGKDASLLTGFVFTMDTPTKILYLTIDDGPSLAGKKMTDYLIEKNISATFFLLCNRINKKSIEKYLHPLFSIGSHSYSHKNFERMSTKSVKKDFEQCEKIFEKYDLDYRLMRPPYGIVTEDVVASLSIYGLSGVLWDTDGYDWGEKSSLSGQSVIEKLKPGSILLLHEQMKFEDFVVLIELLQQVGFSFGKL